MKRIAPGIRYMTPEETACHQLQNAGLMMEYENLMIPLNAGYSDRVMVFQEGSSLLILTTNTRIGYAGLDEIDCQDGDIVGTVFMQEWQLKESIGRKWYHMKPETLISKLQQYL